MENLYVVGMVAGSMLTGLFVIAFGQLLLAIREIALNTRKMASSPETESYEGLRFTSKMAIIVGSIVIVVSLGIGFIAMLSLSQRR